MGMLLPRLSPSHPWKHLIFESLLSGSNGQLLEGKVENSLFLRSLLSISVPS